MGTGIEWTDETWNPTTGCSKVSAGCRNCYAEKLSHRFKMTTKPWNAAFAAENVKVHPDRLGLPATWRKPRRVFVNSMSDLFHEQVPFEFIEQVFATMALAQKHTFQILTKRPERMLEFFKTCDFNPGFREYTPLPNVWLGVSIENQEAANNRIPLLLQTPAAVRFLSCEPLLGPVDLTNINVGVKKTNGYGDRRIVWDSLGGWEHQFSTDRTGCFPNASVANDHSRIDWVITGGESGPNARPMHPEWLRSLRDQCTTAGVAFFFKQWGEWLPYDLADQNQRDTASIGQVGLAGISKTEFGHWLKSGKKQAGRVLDGRTWDEFPAVEAR